MITTPRTLRAACDRWLAQGRGQGILNLVVRKLDAATCQADIRALLPSPRFQITNASATDPHRNHVWVLRVEAVFLLEYTITEVGDEADVSVLP
jgi:hypothetical protein